MLRDDDGIEFSGAHRRTADPGALRTGRSRVPPQGHERVVLVPCSGGSAQQWRRLVEGLSAFEATAVELMGQGGRPAAQGADAPMLADEAAGIAEACGGGYPIHLVGHSYGGAVALKFAALFPERVRSLSLVEPTSFHILKTPEAQDPALLDEISTLADAVDRAVTRGDERMAMAIFVDYWSGAGAWAAMPETKKMRLARLAALVGRHFRSLLGDDTALAAYRRLAVPTLILCGTHSPRPARAVSRLLAEALPVSRHRTIRDAGHMSPLTHPAEVNGWIHEHLLRNRARSVARRGGGVL